jgi:hypothetical protein
MTEFITQYAPFIVTGLGVITPLLPTMIVKAVQDRKAIKTFESIKVESSSQLTEIKSLADSLKQKEQIITQDVSKVKNMVQDIKAQNDGFEVKVDQKMDEIKNQVLAFQNDDLYQKMLSGLGQLDDLHKTIDSQASTIQRQAQELKEIKKKLG